MCMLNSLTGRLTIPGGKIFDRVLFCICYDILNFTSSANKLNKHTHYMVVTKFSMALYSAVG